MNCIVQDTQLLRLSLLFCCCCLSVPCLAAELTPEERCTADGGLDVWMKLYCKYICDGCCNALKMGFEMYVLLSCFEDGSQLQDSLQQPDSLQLNKTTYIPLYVKCRVGKITATKGIQQLKASKGTPNASQSLTSAMPQFVAVQRFTISYTKKCLITLNRATPGSLMLTCGSDCRTT